MYFCYNTVSRIHLYLNIWSGQNQEAINMITLGIFSLLPGMQIEHSLCCVMFDHLWLVLLCHVVCNSHKQHHFWKKKCIWHEMPVLIFFTAFTYIFFSSRRVCRDVVFIWSDWYFCLILTKLEFSCEILVKVPSIKFHGNPSKGIAAVPCRQMDGLTWLS
jgi:hypothetical protein